MKALAKIFLLSTLILLISGSAYCLTITYNDNYANWPGWNIDPRDEIGWPKVKDIQGVAVTIDGASQSLQSVVIALKTNERRVWDTLFINTGGGGKYDSWDFYVRDDKLDNTGHQLYSVDDPNNYAYLLSTFGRPGHPSGIDPNDLTASAISSSVVWDGNTNTLTYTFGSGIVLGRNFVIGYSQTCANDVFLTPEPTTLLLLGAGLIGLGFLARRKIRNLHS